MTPNMVPVCVGNEDCGQRRQPGGVCSQGFVSGFRELRTRSCINPDQFTPVFGHHKIILGELETSECVDTTGNDFHNPPWKKSVPGCLALRERGEQHNRLVKVLVATAPQVIL